MRLATLILSLILMLVVAFQSCATGVVGVVGADRATSEAANAGIVIAILFLIGGAFVLPFPLVSTFVFGLAGLIGASAPTGKFQDLRGWGAVGFVLAVLSFVGWSASAAERGRLPRSARRRPRSAPPAGEVARAPADGGPLALDLPRCNFQNQPDAAFCGGCGATRVPAT